MLPFLLLLVPPAHAAGSMSLVPDPVLMVVQLIPFFATMAVLHYLIFKPMTEYLADRDAATVGTRKAALELTQRADVALAEYEVRLAGAREELSGMRAARRQDALATQEAAIADARAKAEAKVADALEVVEGERELAAQELDRIARGLADEIGSKVLGRDVAA